MKIKQSLKILFLVSISLLFGCEQKAEKTDSMLFRETAIRDAQIPLEKALLLLTDEVKNAPSEHLDTLLIAKNRLRDAQRIYQKSNIGGYIDPKLQGLSTYYTEVSPELVTYSKRLLIDVVDKTVTLRQQIEETKTRPYSARGMDIEQMVDFLGDQYNQDVKGCCLRKLSKIEQLLKSEAKHYRDLLILMRTINSELGEIIKDEAYAITLKKKIASV